MTLNRAILTSLSRTAPYLLPERTLFVDVNVDMPSPVTITELRAALSECEAKGWVVSVRSEVDKDLRYRITNAGTAVLQS